MTASSIRSRWSSTITQETKAQRVQETLTPRGSASWIQSWDQNPVFLAPLSPGIFPLCFLKCVIAVVLTKNGDRSV